MTKRELTAALRIRYHKAEREKKQAILDEFVEISGYHRQHAIRLALLHLRPMKIRNAPESPQIS